MKIVEEGKIPPARKPDWVGAHVKCAHCYTVVELEEGDPVGCEKRPNGKRWITCPTLGCGTQIYVPIYRNAS